jgi:response regulator RpfG family c-di-GMP phosphodiesterase/anti-sigma regulatory factor (Ser/Thr protein kinase)
MKSLNWFTSILVLIGILALIYSSTHLYINQFSIFLVMIAFIVVLEIFALKLPSGDDFEAGSIGILFVLLLFDFGHAVLALTIGLIVAFMKNYNSFKIPWIRLIANVGMYSISALAAYFFWDMTKGINLILSVILAAFIYEFVNLLLLELIQKVMNKRELFTNMRQQLAELIIPVVVYSIVIPTLLIQDTTNETIMMVLYTLFFLLIVIFFSKEYLKQLSLRQSTSKAFIQVLEGRITPSLAGHGNRVAIICDTILEDLGYPKSKRHDLVQAALIHDIGKVLLPSHIFRKRGERTLSEEREYNSHPEKAVEIVKTMFQKDSYSNWILFHHERWDGKGFPKGLKGEEIPYGSRIIALANELDHILERHDDSETVLKLLSEKSGTILDTNLVAKIELHHIEIIVESIQHLAVEKENVKPNEKTEIQLKSYDSYSSVGQSFFIQSENGKITLPDAVQMKHPSLESFVDSLVDIAKEHQQSVHETYMKNDRTLHVFVQEPKDGEVSLFIHDLSPFIEYRNNLERDTLESFVKIIDTLTDGKIVLHTSKADLDQRLGKWLAGMPINTTSDVPKCRELSKEIISQYPTELMSMKVQVSVTEAVTNILKHATGGNLSIYVQDDKLQFFISDIGSGIPLHEIPKTILVSGYSSKRSLGQGFKVITTYSDSVEIYTSSEGTNLLMEYKLKEEESSDIN